MRGFVRLCRFQDDRYKGRHRIGRKHKAALLGPPIQFDRCCGARSCRRATSAITVPGAIASATIRPFSSSLHRRRRTHARYFCTAPNHRRVVINVDHNVHTIHDPKRNRDRAPHDLTRLCGVKAPLTLYRWQKQKQPKPRSKRPKRTPAKTWTPALFEAVEALRLDRPMWGKAKLRPLLRRQGFVVSDATVDRIIAYVVARGVVEPV